MSLEHGICHKDPIPANGGGLRNGKQAFDRLSLTIRIKHVASALGVLAQRQHVEFEDILDRGNHVVRFLASGGFLEK